MKKNIFFYLISLTFLSLFLVNTSTASQTIPILTYHSFSKKNDRRINVSPQQFLEQLQYLASQGYQVIPLERLIEALKLKLPLPQKSVVITIDDGCNSVYEVAFPYLKRFNFPATLFLTLNFVNKDFSWEKIRMMEASKIIDTQGHSKTHYHRGLVRDFKTEIKKSYLKQLERELLESKKIIEKKLNKRVKYLAYPYGKYDQVTIEKAKEYGYEALLACHGGISTLNADPFNLNRQEIHNHDDLKEFASILNTKPLEVDYLNPPLATWTFYKKPKIFALLKKPVNLSNYQITATLDEKTLPCNYDQETKKLSLILKAPLIQETHFVAIQLINKHTLQVEKEVGWIFTKQGIPFITVKSIKIFLKILTLLVIGSILVIIIIKQLKKHPLKT
ncbi:MAG: polysaccharide deacetylase family protein [bacterium]